MKHRLAINLKSIRKERWRMSQDRFAEFFDSSRSKINSYENGGVEPSIAFILRLEVLTSIPAMDLFYGSLNMEQIPPFPLEKGQSFVADSIKSHEEIIEYKELVQFHRMTHKTLQKLEEKIESINSNNKGSD